MQIKTIISLFLFNFTINLYASTYELKGLGEGQSQIKDQNIINDQPQNVSISTDEAFSSSNSEVNSYLENIKALDGLLEMDLPAQKKNSVLMQKAIFHYKLAIAIKDKNSKNYEQNLKTGFNCIKNFLAQDNIEQKKISIAYYLMSLYQSEFKFKDHQIESLEKSIKSDPNSAQVKNISITLGELYFDQKNFEKAIFNYNRKFSSLDDNQKSVANYKIAWAYSLLNKNELAIQKFLEIIGNPKLIAFKLESLRDLAYVTTKFMNEAQLLSFANKKLVANQDKTNFLFNALRYLYYRKERTFKKSIYNELLSKNISPELRINLFAIYLDSEKRDSPSENYKKAILSVFENLDENGIYIESKNFKTYSRDLELAHEFFTKQYIDLYNSKIQNKDQLTRNSIIENLLFHIKFHIKTFTDSQFISSLFNLGITVESERKNTAFEEWFELMKNNSKLSKDDIDIFTTKIKYHKILILDQKAKTDQNTTPYLITAIEEFLLNSKKSNLDVPLREKLFVLYYNNGDLNKAKELAAILYKENPTEKNLLNFYTILFKLEDYNSITENEHVNKSINSPEIKEILKESYLKKALNSNNQKTGFDFDQFEKNITTFIKLSKDKDKILTAYLDYLSKSNKYKNTEYTILNIWNKIPQDLKSSTPLQNYKNTQIIELIKFNKPNLAKKYLPLAQNESEKLNTIIINSMEGLYFPWSDTASWQSLSSKNKLYIIKVYAISQPERVNKYLLSKSNLTAEEENILYFTYQVIQNISEPKLSNDEISHFTFLKNTKKYSNEALQKKLVSFNFEIKNDNKYDSILKINVDEFLKLESLIQKNISKYKLEDRKVIFDQTAEISKKLSDQILKSPIPNDLAPSDKENYVKQLNDIASDYLTKQTNYNNLAIKVEQQITILNKEALTNSFPKLTNTMLFEKYPNFTVIEKLRTEIETSAVLLILDLLKANSQISIEEYWALRSYIIYNKHSDNYIVRNLIRDELKLNQQNLLLSKWLK